MRGIGHDGQSSPERSRADLRYRRLGVAHPNQCRSASQLQRHSRLCRARTDSWNVQSELPKTSTWSASAIRLEAGGPNSEPLMTNTLGSGVLSWTRGLSDKRAINTLVLMSRVDFTSKSAHHYLFASGCKDSIWRRSSSATGPYSWLAVVENLPL